MGACGGCFEGVAGKQADKANVQVKLLGLRGRVKYEQFNLAADSTIDQLKDLIWDSEFVHPKCQSLYYAEQTSECAESQTIREFLEKQTSPDVVTFDCTVDYDSFPQKLGPFSIATVPLKASDFVVSVNVTDPQYSEKGFYWDMKMERLQQHGVTAPGTHIVGQVSPVTPITLGDNQRLILQIPDNAKLFAWSYPVENWIKAERIDGCKANEAEAFTAVPEGPDAVICFFSVGGYLYFDEAGKIVACNTVCRFGQDDGALHFGMPKRLKPEWVDALGKRERFQKVTLTGLAADYFCWMSASDKLKDSRDRVLKAQPMLPAGGFAYLIDDYPGQGHGRGSHNCYYPMRVMGLSAAAGNTGRQAKPISYTLTVRDTVRDKTVGMNFSDNPPLDDLKCKIWEALMMHPLVQRLQYKGREQGDTLKSLTGLKDFGAELVLDLQYDSSQFPQQLGPFSITQVPLNGAAFIFPEKQGGVEIDLRPGALVPFERVAPRREGDISKDKEPEGTKVNDFLTNYEIGERVWYYSTTKKNWFMARVTKVSNFEGVVTCWELASSELLRYGLQAWGTNVRGHISPLSRVTVQGSQKQAYMIPEAATQTAFSYPACDALVKAGEKFANDDRSLVSNFLSVGGFMYFDDDLNVVGMTTLRLSEKGEKGGMAFGFPKMLKREWTDALVKQNRFKEVTIEEFREEPVLCQYFCWLCPGEKIPGLADNNQPQLPNGGFAYLFHEDPKTTKGIQVDYDCYFPIKEQLLTSLV